MKITRQKHAKKHLGFFRNNFGVREPYQILLDGTFCQAALRGRIQLREQLPRYLMGETQLCTTRWAGRGAGTGPRPCRCVHAEAAGCELGQVCGQHSALRGPRAIVSLGDRNTSFVILVQSPGPVCSAILGRLFVK